MEQMVLNELLGCGKMSMPEEKDKEELDALGRPLTYSMVTGMGRYMKDTLT
jgi:hypothetical protein